MKQLSLVIFFFITEVTEPTVPRLETKFVSRHLSIPLPKVICFIWEASTLFSRNQGILVLPKQEDEIANNLLKKKIVFLLFVSPILQNVKRNFSWKLFGCEKKSFLFSAQPFSLHFLQKSTSTIHRKWLPVMFSAITHKIHLTRYNTICPQNKIHKWNIFRKKIDTFHLLKTTLPTIFSTHLFSVF